MSTRNNNGSYSRDFLTRVQGLNFRGSFIHSVHDEYRPSLDRIRELREKRIAEKENIALFKSSLAEWCTTTKRQVFKEKGLFTDSRSMHPPCQCINFISSDGQRLPSQCLSYIGNHLIDVTYVPTNKRKQSLIFQAFPILSFTLSRKFHSYPNISESQIFESSRYNSCMERIIVNQLGADHSVSDYERALKLCLHRMKRIFNNMKAAMNSVLIHITGWLFLHVMGKLFTSITVSRSQIEVLTNCYSSRYPVLFLPLHRSHLDYILFPLVMWYNDLPLAYVAAGDNLNVPLLGRLLRGFGGFFIRRSLDRSQFSDTALYVNVLQCYMEALLSQQQSLVFYLEAGRSRTGRSRPYKKGLLSGVIKAFQEGVVQDVIIVPMAISYEVVPDANYQSELLGGTKAPETLSGSISSIFRFLFRDYGMVRFNFSHPFALSSFCRQYSHKPRCEIQPSYIKETQSMTALKELGANPTYSESIDYLAGHVMYSANKSNCIMITHLLSFSLLYQHRDGASMETLLYSVKDLTSRYLSQQVAFSGSWEAIIRRGCRLLSSYIEVSRCSEITSEYSLANCFVTLKNDLYSVLQMRYYSQVVLCHISLFSALSCCFAREIGFVSGIYCHTTSAKISSERMNLQMERFCQILIFEFYFQPPCTSIKAATAGALSMWSHLMKKDEYSMELCAINSQNGDPIGTGKNSIDVDLDDPTVVTRLSWLCRCMSPILETYRHTVLAAIRLLPHRTITESQFLSEVIRELQCQYENRQIIYPESLCKESVQNCVKSLINLSLIEQVSLNNKSILQGTDFDGLTLLLRDIEGYIIADPESF